MENAARQQIESQSKYKLGTNIHVPMEPNAHYLEEWDYPEGTKLAYIQTTIEVTLLRQ